jgi:hypothetical protein
MPAEAAQAASKIVPAKDGAEESEAPTLVVTRMLSSKVTTRIPIQARPLLIGVGGRNVSLIAKHAQAFIQCNDEGEVTLVPRAKDSDLELGKRMIHAVIAGAIVRWFMHAGSAKRVYEASGVRTEMQALAATLTLNTCALQLLRAHKGRLCLFLMPPVLATTEEDVPALIRAARPVLLARLRQGPELLQREPSAVTAPAPAGAAQTPTPQ